MVDRALHQHRRVTDPVPVGPETPRVSVIVTVYNEGDTVVECLDRIFESVRIPAEVLVVYDADDDTTRQCVDAVNNLIHLEQFK